MSTHPCPTCGHVHEAPPPVDWTGYEDAVREYIAAWLAEQEHQLNCWRDREPIEDPKPIARVIAAEKRVLAILRPIMPNRGYLLTAPSVGSVWWFPYGGGERIVLYTHADGPIRPDGAA